MKIYDVAKLLGVSEKTLRDGLRLGVYPFGVAYKKDGNSKYTYTLYPKKVEEYVGGINYEES